MRTGRRTTLRADCTRCVGLCCVAHGFSASSEFAIDKPAGRPCPNLVSDFRCGIHGQLRQRGFPGCVAYDCLGAGQQVVQVTFGGRDWRQTPEIAEQMCRVFLIMRYLYEVLWYLDEALTLDAAQPLRGDLGRAFDETERLIGESPDALDAFDRTAHWQPINNLLYRVSDLARKDFGRRKVQLARGSRVRLDFRGADLRGVSLRNAPLIGADFTCADLSFADLIMTDLRGADLSGANLATSLFLTQYQVNFTRGDAATRLPPAISRPAYWR